MAKERSMALKEMYGKCRKSDPKIWIASYVLLSAFLLYWYPPVQVSHFGINNATNIANLENQYRMTLAQILGGGAVAIGIYFAWGNLTTAREGQITERFTRAVDQLGAIDQSGNPAIEIRLGGIYALERIANESDKDYWPIMEILTTYVRKNSNVETVANTKVMQIVMDIQANESTKSEISKVRNISLDIQAILTVIGNRKWSNSIDLQKAYLQDAYLSYANLQRANLQRANLQRANLQGANLQGANLYETNLQEANLKMADLGSKKINIKYKLLHSLLKNINSFVLFFIENKATIAGFQLSINNICCTINDLNKTHLERANLRKANLQMANFARSNLQEASFFRANLQGAHLQEANLQGANLTGANLTGANLEGADFQRADLRGANLTGAHFQGAKNLLLDQLSKVITLYGAIFDEELEEFLREKYPALFWNLKDEP